MNSGAARVRPRHDSPFGLCHRWVQTCVNDVVARRRTLHEMEKAMSTRVIAAAAWPAGEAAR